MIVITWKEDVYVKDAVWEITFSANYLLFKLKNSILGEKQREISRGEQFKSHPQYVIAQVKSTLGMQGDKKRKKRTLANQQVSLWQC